MERKQRWANQNLESLTVCGSSKCPHGQNGGFLVVLRWSFGCYAMSVDMMLCVAICCYAVSCHLQLMLCGFIWYAMTWCDATWGVAGWCDAFSHWDVMCCSTLRCFVMCCVAVCWCAVRCIAVYCVTLSCAALHICVYILCWCEDEWILD